MRMRRTVAVAAALTAFATLTGCVSNADPSDVEWTLVAEGDIVSLGDNTSVYIEGHFGYLGGGHIESKQIIDYKYARVLNNGGFRQDLVSSTYERLVDYDDYPGSEIVTIFQDAESDGEGARIEIYRCSSDIGFACVMPDGQPMGASRHRIDIHVPPGSVIEPFGDNEGGDTEAG